MRLAQEMAALHLTLARLLDDLHDLSPVLVPAVTLGMVLQPVMDELGGAIGDAIFLDEPAGGLLWASLKRKRVSGAASRRVL